MRSTGKTNNSAAGALPLKRALVTEPWGVERATETLIVEPKTWKILYQGPINDRVTFGRAKAKPDNDYATVTLDAMLAGKAVTPSYNMTDGCIISFEKRGH